MRVHSNFSSGSLSRPFFAQIECTLRSEKEAKEQLLQKQLREADLNTVAAQILSDFAVLEKMAPGPTRQAEEHALDMKYLRDRQAPLRVVRSRDLFILSCFKGLSGNFPLGLAKDGATMQEMRAPNEVHHLHCRYHRVPG